MKKYSLGAHIDKTRKTPPVSFGVIELPPSIITDISMLPVLDQGDQEACVGHAGANAVNYDYFKKNGVVPQSSARWNYGVAKIVDGNLDAGTSALSMFKGWKETGGSATTKTMPNDVTLSVEAYSNIMIDGVEEQDATKYPIKNEVDIANPTAQELMTLIAQYGVVPIAVEVDENTWMAQDGLVSLKPGNAGGHEILLFGYETVGNDIKFHILNSWNTTWGKNGTGTFMWSDYNGSVFDAMSVTIAPVTQNLTPEYVYIKRGVSDTKETLGTLTAGNFTCSTLELPWLNNETNVSCIPTGTYQCVWTFMPDMNTYHYEIQEVPDRSGVFIHPANRYSQLEGCIALGVLGELQGDTEEDVLSSVNTVNSFEALFPNHESFTLTIS